jgi:hypothetical protein
MSAYTQAWLAAFTCTVVVELIVATPALAPSGAHWARRSGIVVLANLASHPLVWLLFAEAAPLGQARIVAAELFALLVEGAAYLLVWPAIGARRAFGASALANGASFGASLLLRALGVRV